MPFADFQEKFKSIATNALRSIGMLGMDPNRDWRVLLISALMLLLLSGVGSGLLFVKVNSGEFAAVAPKTPGAIESIDRTQLMETLGTFAEKEERFNTLQAEAPTVVDPSL